MAVFKRLTGDGYCCTRLLLNAHMTALSGTCLHHIIVQCPKTGEHSSRMHTTCQFQETAGLLKEKRLLPTNLFLGI